MGKLKKWPEKWLGKLEVFIYARRQPHPKYGVSTLFQCGHQISKGQLGLNLTMNRREAEKFLKSRKFSSWDGGGRHIFDPSTPLGRQRQVNLCTFKDSLIYIVSSGIATYIQKKKRLCLRKYIHMQHITLIDFCVPVAWTPQVGYTAMCLYFLRQSLSLNLKLLISVRLHTSNQWVLPQ